MVNRLRYIPEESLEIFLEEIAERGATKALARIGLHDDEAGKDILELRTLIGSWRVIRRSAWSQAGKFIGQLLCVAMLMGIIALAKKDDILFGLFKH